MPIQTQGHFEAHTYVNVPETSAPNLPPEAVSVTHAQLHLVYLIPSTVALNSYKIL